MSKYLDERRSLGIRLRQLRDDARLTGEELAHRLGWVQSKVSKIETGRQPPTAGELRRWLDAVDAPEHLAAELVGLLMTVTQHYEAFRQAMRSGSVNIQKSVQDQERRATELRHFQTAMVPGLLQTVDYMRCVISSPDSPFGPSETEVEAAIATRISRQQVLYDQSKQFYFLFGDGVLRTMVGPPAVVAAQMDRLAVMNGLSTVQVGVVPPDAHLSYPPLHPFLIFDEESVRVETLTGNVIYGNQEDVEQYRRFFDSLWQRAETGALASAALRTRAAELAPA